MTFYDLHFQRFSLTTVWSIGYRRAKAKQGTQSGLCYCKTIQASDNGALDLGCKLEVGRKWLGPEDVLKVVKTMIARRFYVGYKRKREVKDASIEFCLGKWGNRVVIN